MKYILKFKYSIIYFIINKLDMFLIINFIFYKKRQIL